MNVILLDQARARLRTPRRIEPPAALSPHARPRHPTLADDGEDRLRMRQNLAALLVIVAIVTIGSWLMASLQYYSRVQTCLEAGHRHCVPLEAEAPTAPDGR
jgi:hypothetical protein